MPLRISRVTSATVEGNYNWVYARVYAGKEYGTGEGFHGPLLEGIIKEFGRLLIGEDPLNINRLLEKMYWASIPSGNKGLNFHAISALETALLDLAAKHYGIPVYSMLGGKLRDKVRIYVDAHAGESLEAMDSMLLPVTPKWMTSTAPSVYSKGEQLPIHGRMGSAPFSDSFTAKSYSSRAKAMKKEGFTAIKFDLDVPTPYTKKHNNPSGSLTGGETQYLAELVSATREGVGDETDIMFDLHWKYNVQSSIGLAKAIEPYRVMWLEDPVPPANLTLVDRVASATTTPIATGENLYSRYEFDPLLKTSVRIITPDAMKVGGLFETKLIAGMAQIHEIVFSPHNIGSPIGTMAQAQVAAAVPNFGVLEFHGHDVPIWEKMTKRKIIKSGFIELGDEPGLGVELDETQASRYALNEKFEL